MADSRMVCCVASTSPDPRSSIAGIAGLTPGTSGGVLAASGASLCKYQWNRPAP